MPDTESNSPLGPYYRAEEFYKYCIQYSQAGKIQGSENCLYLNVYTPRVCS